MDSGRNLISPYISWIFKQYIKFDHDDFAGVKPRSEIIFKDWTSGEVRIGGFDMTSQIELAKFYAIQLSSHWIFYVFTINY